uniref:CidA/LrgA family protein n=1 Tax=Gemmiger formicilis TaxID=745368 RepID=UPI00402560C4
MQYIFQFARITAFCLAGEVLAAVLPLPIPASVYGLLLLAAALKFGVLKLDQVRETGLFLTGIFPLLFVPAAAGVMELGSQLMNLLLPAVLAIVPITALVMAVTGMVAQKCAGGKEHKNG